MTLRDCVNRAVAGGEMDRARAERVLREYDGVFEELRGSMGHTQAQAEAARRVLDQVRRDAFEKRRTTQLDAAATARQMDRMANHRSRTGKFDPGGFLLNLIESPRGAGGETLVGQYRAVKSTLMREMTQGIRQFRANLVGMRRNKATLADVEAELFGASTGNDMARGIAQSFSRAAEIARTRFNAAGGRIPKRADWGLPQRHDGRTIAAAGYDEWRAFMLEDRANGKPRIDLDQMIDEATGLPFTRESIEPVMADAYQAITTDGLSRRGPSATGGGKALRNRRADHRFFKFSDVDAWREYNSRFGGGQDAFRIMIGHLEGMALDISAMEVLGTNPDFQMRYLRDAARIAAARTGDQALMRKTATDVRAVDDLFEMFMGRTNIGSGTRFGRIMSASRNFLTSAHLGAAVFSSVTDFNNQRLAADFVGMRRTSFLRDMGNLLRSKAMRDAASDSNLIFENAVNIGSAAARYELEEIHVEAAARAADFTIRASGLGFLTEIQRHSAGLAFMRTAASDWKGKAFADLDPRTSRALAAFGISERDWAAISNADLHRLPNGLEVLRSQEIAEVAGQRVADRYHEMMSTMIEFAVPTQSMRARSAILRRTSPDTVIGQFARSGLQFKSFPMAIMMTQLGRVADEWAAGRPMYATRYLAGLVVVNTLLGGLAIQLKDMSKGKDPRDMGSPKFWPAAVAQGGGLGIFGDFLFQDVNRFGNSLTATLAGPGAGLLEDAGKLTVGNIQDVAAGRDTEISGELVQFMRRYTPGGSLWYARLLLEREVFDAMQGIVDPDAEKAFRRRARNAKKYGTQYFWPPGKSAIQGDRGIRAPELENVAGGTRQ